MRIAALYVDPRGHYAGLPGVELWDEKRDARGYRGPYPVVAHPPCSRWCLVSNCGNHVPETETRRRLIKREAFITPLEFRDVLLGIARSSWMSEATKAT